MKNNDSSFGLIAVVIAVIAGVFAMKRGGPLLASLGKSLIGLVIAAAVVIALIVIVVICFAFGDRVGSGSGKKDAPIDSAGKELIDSGYRRLTEIRQVASRIKNKPIHERAGKLCKQIEKLLVTLREKPDTIQRARRFLNYYLPTLEKVLTKYHEMERGGVADSQMSDKVAACLDQISTACEKQHRNLFDADILDLTAEMQVMSQLLKRDGLSDDGGFSSDDENAD